MPSVRQLWRRLKAGPKFDLPYILDRARPDSPFADRVEFCENLLDWIRYTGQGKTTASARVRFLLQLLDRKPEWKERSATVIRSVIAEAAPYRAFHETGVPHGQTFVAEITSRFFQILLPVAEESTSLHALLLRAFYDAEDPVWIEKLPAETWREIIDGWIFPGPIRLASYERALADAALSLCVQGAALSLRSEFTTRSPEFGMDAHPFLQLEAHLAALVAQTRRDPKARDAAEIRESVEGVASESERARAQIRSVRNHLEEFGVSVDLVYQMDRMKLYLERICCLVGTLEAVLSGGKKARLESLSLFKSLVFGVRYDEDFRFVFRKGIRLLSTKVVERTGSAGEHYFASTWPEWKHFFWAAAGGGALTAVTAMLKSFGPGSPPFAELVYSAINYGGCFVLMHFLGLKLATKQPSMTAAALAGKLSDTGGKSAGEEKAFVEEVARVTRAQFAAVMGNVIWVVPATLVIDSLWVTYQKAHFYSAAKATATIASVSLTGSGTLWFGFLTGIILWVSSLGAGFVENWVVLIRAPELVKNHRILRAILGPARAERLGRAIPENASGVAGAVILGILLAAAPVTGKFFGLPIDARHVTLTTGSLTFAFLGLETGHGVPLAMLSVAVIACLNFGVSFFFAILTALRARNIDLLEGFHLLRKSARRFRRNPLVFLFPPRRSAE
jgi:site-specific recombinase